MTPEVLENSLQNLQIVLRVRQSEKDIEAHRHEPSEAKCKDHKLVTSVVDEWKWNRYEEMLRGEK